MRHMTPVLLLTLFFTALLLSPAYASVPTNTYRHTLTVTGPYDTPWPISLSMTVTDRDFTSLNAAYDTMYASFAVNGIPTKVWKYGTPGYILQRATAELILRGTHTYTAVSKSQSEPSTGWGDTGGISLDSRTAIVEENREGTYFWDLHVVLAYAHTTSVGTTDTYDITYDLIPPYESFSIVSFSTTGSWESQIERGITCAFSQVWNIWVVAGQKIELLPWANLLSLNVLGFIGNIFSLMLYFGYALFRTMTLPITTISLLMAHLQNAMVVSFFFLSLVVVVLISILLLMVLWKIIILVKP